MNNLEELNYAKQLGRIGFRYNRRVPAHDKKLMHLLKGMKPGNPHGINLLNSWNGGWDEAHENSNEYKQTMKDVFGGKQS